MNKQEIIQISDLHASDTNPRGEIVKNEEFLNLVSSIRHSGVLVPVIVRIKPKAGRKFEVVAGARRLAAALAAGLKDMPAVVMELGDDEAREVQIIENLQRKDVHPLEEAEAYLKLVKTSADFKAVAAKVGKNETYIKNRVMLNALVEDVKKAYREGVINDGHAVEIARLSPGGDQQKALTHVKERTSWGKSYPVKELRGWIDDIFFDKLAYQPWLKSVEAMAAVGSCKECPKETNTLFGQAKEGACTTTRCHKRKMQKYIDWMKEKTPGLVLVSTEYGRKAGVLSEYDYKKVAKDSKGSKPALVVDGTGRGKIINVKVSNMPVAQMTPEEKAKRDEVAKKQRDADKKRDDKRLADEGRKMDNTLKNVSWPLKEKHLEPLLDLMIEHENNIEDIASRRQLPGEKDEDGNYKDAEQAVRDFFGKTDARVKMQIVVEVGLGGTWHNEQIMKKFN